MGILLGFIVVVLWSSTASRVFLGSSSLGLWPFLCLFGLFAGLALLAIHVIWKREIRSCVIIPATFWMRLVFGFVFYILLYTMAIYLSASHEQVRAVNLINYTWPALMVLCALVWVPGTQATPRLLTGLALSLLGLASSMNVFTLGPGLYGEDCA